MTKHTSDDDEWEEVQIEARPSGSSVFSFRLPTPEFHALSDAAKAAEMTTSAYIRAAIRQRMQPPATTTWTENVAHQESHIEISMQQVYL